MLTAVDGLVKGSARSIEGYDLFAAIRACEDQDLNTKHFFTLAVAITSLLSR
jgi:single-stranded DNA-specific DHH superfamily exonuclease